MRILVVADVLGEPNNGTTIAALNLINALNQYKRFVMLMNERKKFVLGLLDFSRACIEFFEQNKDVNKSSHDAIVEKMNNLIKTMNVINDQINNTFQDSVKDYLK